MHTLLGAGLRREELVNLDLDQVTPNTPEALRAAKKAKISGMRGKGRTSRTVFLGADGHTALADYLENERSADAGETSTALFLSAVSIGSRCPDGRLSPRSINLICDLRADRPVARRRTRRSGPAHQPAMAPRPAPLSLCFVPGGPFKSRLMLADVTVCDCREGVTQRTAS